MSLVFIKKGVVTVPNRKLNRSEKEDVRKYYKLSIMLCLDVAIVDKKFFESKLKVTEKVALNLIGELEFHGILAKSPDGLNYYVKMKNNTKKVV